MRVYHREYDVLFHYWHGMGVPNCLLVWNGCACSLESNYYFEGKFLFPYVNMWVVTISSNICEEAEEMICAEVGVVSLLFGTVIPTSFNILMEMFLLPLVYIHNECPVTVVP